MRQYNTEVGTVIEVQKNVDYKTIGELIALIDSLDIDYIPRLSDLEFDNLSFCFNNHDYTHAFLKGLNYA